MRRPGECGVPHVRRGQHLPCAVRHPPGKLAPLTAAHSPYLVGVYRLYFARFPGKALAYGRLLRHCCSARLFAELRPLTSGQGCLPRSRKGPIASGSSSLFLDRYSTGALRVTAALIERCGGAPLSCRPGSTSTPARSPLKRGVSRLHYFLSLLAGIIEDRIFSPFPSQFADFLLSFLAVVLTCLHLAPLPPHATAPAQLSATLLLALVAKDNATR